MKKILRVVIIFFMLVLLNIKAFANMETPNVKIYTAVIEKDGTGIYDSNFNYRASMLYGSVVEIISETEYEGKVYANCWKIDGEHLDFIGLINIEDLKIIDEKESFEYDKELKKEGVVLSKNGLEIWKCPARIYGSMDMVIPNGTKIDLYPEKDNYESAWYYTEYNGKGGWVSEIYDTIGYEKKGDFITYEDMDLYEVDSETDDSKTIGMIPANTEMNKYYVFEKTSNAELIGFDYLLDGYKKHTLFVEPKEVAFKHTQQLKVIQQGVKIYQKYIQSKNKEKTWLQDRELTDVVYEEIPVGTILETIYVTDEIPVGTISIYAPQSDEYYTSICYIEYDGVKGWIYKDGTVELDSSEENTKVLEENLQEVLDVEKDDKIEDITSENQIGDIIISNEIAEQFISVSVCITGVIICISIVSIILINKKSKK